MKPSRPLLGKMQPSEAVEAAALVSRAYIAAVAADYSAEGNAEFLRYACAEGLAARHAAGTHLTLVARHESPHRCGAIVGMLELRGNDHVSLFFVDPHSQGQGVGRMLWVEALASCRKQKSFAGEISVNSSRAAVPVYSALGFAVVGEYQIKNGIGFIPMLFRDNKLPGSADT